MEARPPAFVRLAAHLWWQPLRGSGCCNTCGAAAFVNLLWLERLPKLGAGWKGPAPAMEALLNVVLRFVFVRRVPYGQATLTGPGRARREWGKG